MDTSLDIDTHGRTRPATIVAALAAAWSLVAMAVGLWWLNHPGGYPFDAESGNGLTRRLPTEAACTALVVLAGIGAVGAAVQAMRRSAPPRVLVVLAAGYAVLFGLLVPDDELLIVLAYSIALGLPLAVLAGLALSVRTARGAVVAVGAVVALTVAGVLSGTTEAENVTRFLTGVADGFVTNVGLRPFKLLFFLAGGLAWAALAIQMHRQRVGQCLRCGRPGAAWTTRDAAARWGRPVTIAAAACALPYGLLRMTWLTPWPQGANGLSLSDQPEIRLTGLLLGSAALVGFTLTLGLIRPWGEVWPRWVPRLRGRSVPLAAAVVPATIVSLFLAVAGISLTPTLVSEGGYTYALFFPFPLWAPLLAAATLAYYLRRRGDCPLPHQSVSASGAGSRAFGLRRRRSAPLDVLGTVQRRLCRPGRSRVPVSSSSPGPMCSPRRSDNALCE